MTTWREESKRVVRESTLNLMRHLDAACLQRVLDAAQHTQTQVSAMADRYAGSPALSLEHLVEPMLDALGFTAEHRSVEPHRPNVYHLYAQGKPMALLVANALDSTFAGNPGLTNSNPRYRFVREDTGYGGRIAFTNGLNWIVFDGDPEVPPYQFTVDQPEAFWDLFLLALPNRLVLTERDFTPTPTVAPNWVFRTQR